MKQVNCSKPDCKNYGRYWRSCGHGGESFTPAVIIKKVADVQKALLAQYKKIAKKFLALHPVCQVKGCKAPAVCVHHKRGRIGKLLVDIKHFMAVCMEHHRKIEDNPDWAKENGYSDSRLTEKA